MDKRAEKKNFFFFFKRNINKHEIKSTNEKFKNYLNKIFINYI